MNLDRFTNKAQESITNTKNYLPKYGHSQVTPEHLLLSLLEQEEGLTPAIVEKLDAKPQRVLDEAGPR